MQLLLLLALFLLFLFTFYSIVKDDFYFIRKNITLDDLFDTVITGIFWGGILSRIVFAAEHFQPGKNVIGLLFFPPSPGFSFQGMIIGSLLVFFIVTKRRHILTWKFLDYVAISYLSVFPLLFLTVFSNIYIFLIYTVLFLFFFFVLLPMNNRGVFKEGNIALLFLIMFSLVSLLDDVVALYRNNALPAIEDYVYICIFLFASLLLIRTQLKSSSK